MTELVAAAIYAIDYYVVGAALTATTVTAISYAIVIAASYAIASSQARSAQRRARDAFNDSLEDRLVMTATADKERSWVYGRVRNVDGVLFKGTWGADKENYTLVIAVAGHEVAAIDRIWFNDVAVTLDGSGYVQTAPYARTDKKSAMELMTISGGSGSKVLAHTPISGTISVSLSLGAGEGDLELTPGVSGSTITVTGASSDGTARIGYQYNEGTSYARVRKYLGAPDQDIASILTPNFPEVTSNDKFRGIALLVVDLTFSQDAFPTGVPHVTAEVSGASVIDIRNNRMPSPNFEGAVVGGALPAGWSMAAANGIVFEVTGLDFVGGQATMSVRVHGTASATGSIVLQMPGIANTVAASSGATWSARCSISSAGVWNWGGTSRFHVLSVNASDVVDELDSQALNGSAVVAEATGTIVQTGTVRAGARILLAYANGTSYDTTLTLSMPQLWSGTSDPTRWAMNPALIARAWALNPNGCGLNVSQLNDASFITAANACDVNTTFHLDSGDISDDTFVCSIVCDTTAPLSGFEAIIEAMAGRWQFSGGRLRVVAGHYRSPVATITEDWLTDQDSIKIVPEAAIEDSINIVRPTFANAGGAGDYLVTPAPPVIATSYIEVDGEELPLEATYQGIRTSWHAQHVAGIALRENRASLTASLPCNMRAWRLELFDVVNVTLARFGWNAKTFEVLGWSFNQTGGITLQLKEINASIFDPDAGFGDLGNSDNTALPTPWVVDPIIGLAVSSGTTALIDGSVLTRTLVEWEPSIERQVTDSGHIEVQYVQASEHPADADWPSLLEAGSAITSTIAGLITGNVYLFRVRAINAIGVRSAWSAQVAHKISAAPLVDTGGIAPFAATEVRNHYSAVDGVDFSTSTNLIVDADTFTPGYSCRIIVTTTFDAQGPGDWDTFHYVRPFLCPTSDTSSGTHVGASGQFGPIKSLAEIRAHYALHDAFDAIGGVEYKSGLCVTSNPGDCTFWQLVVTTEIIKR